MRSIWIELTYRFDRERSVWNEVIFFRYIERYGHEKQIKKPLFKGLIDCMAESMRFELMVAWTTQPFQDCTLNHSDKTPDRYCRLYLNPWNRGWFLYLGRTKGIEPSNDGTTTRCVNHFTTFAVCQARNIITDERRFVNTFIEFFMINWYNDR